jgi:outer membrane autotransporter protein
LIQPVPQYDRADQVYVVFEMTQTFASQALTPNQEAVGKALDHALADDCVPNLINFLVNEPLSALPHDYDLIAPEELASLYEISISQAVVQNNNLQRRMDDIRAGSNGFCAEGFQVRETQGFSKGTDGKTVIDKNPAPYMQPAPDNRWGVFVTGFGEFVDVGNEDFNARGFEITNAGFTLGVDYRVCDNFAIGLNAGYAHSWADLVDHGRVTVDGGKIGAYATWFSGGFHVDGAISGGFNDYDTVRTGLQDLPVRGSTNGAELNGLFAIGYDFRFGCLNVGPIMTVQYTYVNIEGFTETGSLAPLEIQDQAEDSVRGTLGLRAAYDWKAGNGIIVRPEVRAAWQHEYD